MIFIKKRSPEAAHAGSDEPTDPSSSSGENCDGGENREETTKMRFDSVFPVIGDFGRYQKRIYILICLPTIACAMHKLAWVFLGAKLDHRYVVLWMQAFQLIRK